MATTITISELKHMRPRRLSLISSAQSTFLDLPIEISLAIFETAILQCKPKDLALVSKAFCKVLDAVLYRTVVLDSPKVIELFNRTVQSKSRSFLADNVKRIVITQWPTSFTSHNRIHDIIAACTGIRALLTPSCRTPIDISAANLAAESGLNTITIQSFDSNDNAYPRLSWRSLTHLRFCEPSDKWYSPTTILAAFGFPPHLTHLQLARKAHANEVNDVMFASDVCELLQSLPALKMLVVSIFNDPFTFDLVEDSGIWKRMCDIRNKDKRVVVVQGSCHQWKEGWESHKSLCSGQYPGDFWMNASKSDSAANA